MSVPPSKGMKKLDVEVLPLLLKNYFLIPFKAIKTFQVNEALRSVYTYGMVLLSVI